MRQATHIGTYARFRDLDVVGITRPISICGWGRACRTARRASRFGAIVAGMESPFKRWFGTQCPSCHGYEYVSDIDTKTTRNWSEGRGLIQKKFSEREHRHRKCGHVWSEIVETTQYQ